uniref:Uncharacterized protein n=1 Tax=Lepeophtheirus salmonis TaxID=72036 RepID=A0A0K2U746_LEPSM
MQSSSGPLMANLMANLMVLKLMSISVRHLPHGFCRFFFYFLLDHGYELGTALPVMASASRLPVYRFGVVLHLPGFVDGGQGHFDNDRDLLGIDLSAKEIAHPLPLCFARTFAQKQNKNQIVAFCQLFRMAPTTKMSDF